jgi:hypothetical protein
VQGSSPSGDATAAITQTWTAFFNYQSSAAQRQALLEDGSTLGQAMAMGDRLAKKEKLQETVKVHTVTLTDSAHATVSYDILSHGSVILPGSTGTAVLVNGKWLVSKQSFCGLIELGAGGQTIPGCTPTSY